MSWAALIVAGVVVAQYPPPPSAAPTAPLAQPQLGEAGSSQDPLGGFGGSYTPQGSGSQAPAPAWQPSEPNAGIPSAASSMGQPAVPPPLGAGSVGAEPSAPQASKSNIWGALLRNQDLVDEKAAPNVPPPNPSQPAIGSDPARFGDGARQPADPSRGAAQVPAAPRFPAEEMLDQAMTLPAGTAITGREVTLLDVIGRVTDRAKRVEITHAYWHLARKLGEFRFCWEESRQIQAFGQGTIDPGVLRSAQQAADRELTAAELALIQAQYRLAEVARLDTSGQLPLPGDRLHLGSYDTYFEKIFVNSTPPAGTRLLHRTLPLQYQVIDVRGEAVHAAQDAYQAIARAYQVEAADLFAVLREITAQRRAWITSVAGYNHSIADYALAIAGPETTGRELVGILIKLSQAEPRGARDKSANLAMRFEPSLSQGADSDAPIGTPSVDRAKPGVPTLAPPRREIEETADSQGVPPVPMDLTEKADLAVKPVSAEEAVMADGSAAPDAAVEPAVVEAPASSSTPVAKAVGNEQDDVSPETVEAEGPSEEAVAKDEVPPAASPPAEEIMKEENAVTSDTVLSGAIAEESPSAPEALESDEASPRTQALAIQQGRMVPVEEPDTAAGVRTALRPPSASSSASLVRQYGDLADLLPAVRAKRLTAALLGGADRVRPEAKVVDLEDCLDGVSGGRCRTVIEAYWEAAQRVAEYEVYRRHEELLDGLVEPVTLGRAGTPDAMARLKAAKLDAKAEILEAETRLLATQYELTRRSGRSLDGPWLLPKTLPHAGDYRLELDAQPARIVQSWTVRKLATIIPVLNRSLNDRAGAVVEADLRRVETIDAYWSQTIRFDRVLSAVDLQTQESLEFLKVLAAYNQSIADYATTLLPEAVPRQLVATLVVR